MSGRQIANATIGSSWESEVESKDLLKKGFYNMEFTNMNTHGEPAVKTGSVVEVSGVLYAWDSAEEIVGTIPTTDGYVVITISGGEAIAEFTTEVPTAYDSHKNGYYTIGGSRYVLGFKSVYSLKYYMDDSYFKKPKVGITVEAGTCYGVYGKAVSFGIYGTASNAYGVMGVAPNCGIFGCASECTGICGYAAVHCGVVGIASCCYGVVGCATSCYGVYGHAPRNGVWGEATCRSGVYGYSYGCVGVNGVSASCGVLGHATNYGVYGCADNFGVYGKATDGISVGGNTSYNSASDEHLKIQKESISVLSCLKAKPIQQFKWRWERAFEGDLEYIAPMAQDVQNTFNLDDDNDGYSTLDGIALFGVQELLREVEKLKLRITKLEEEQDSQGEI